MHPAPLLLVAPVMNLQVIRALEPPVRTTTDANIEQILAIHAYQFVDHGVRIIKGLIERLVIGKVHQRVDQVVTNDSIDIPSSR